MIVSVLIAMGSICAEKMVSHVGQQKAMQFHFILPNGTELVKALMLGATKAASHFGHFIGIPPDRFAILKMLGSRPIGWLYSSSVNSNLATTLPASA